MRVVVLEEIEGTVGAVRVWGRFSTNRKSDYLNS